MSKSLSLPTSLVIKVFKVGRIYFPENGWSLRSFSLEYVVPGTCPFFV